MPDRTGSEDRRRLTVVLVAASLGMFIVQLDFLAFNVALPVMAREMGTTVHTMQWIVSGYQMAFAALLIAGGRIGDIFGRRKTLMSGLALFSLSAVVAGVSDTPALIIGFRACMGASAALIYPVAVPVIANAFHGAGQGRAIGIAYGVAGMGCAVGPIVGGAFTELLSWRWVFFAMVPLAMTALVLVRMAVEESRDESAPRKIDVLGVITVSVGIALATYATNRGPDWGWLALPTLVLFGAGLALLGMFLMVEHRATWPLVDLKLFRNPGFTNIGIVLVVFVATIYLQQVENLTPMKTGLVFIGPAVGTSLGGILAGRLAGRLSPTWILAGANLIGGVGAIWLGFSESLPGYAIAFAIAGLGFGTGWAYASVGTQAVVNPKRAGEASGVTLTVLVGMAGVAIVVVSTIVRLLEQGGYSHAEALRDMDLGVGALAIGAAVVVALLAREVQPKGGAAAGD